MAGNPLEVDPECANFAKLIARQAGEVDFGFSKRQVRNLVSTPRGKEIWSRLNENCIKMNLGKRRFDFRQFCNDMCQPEFGLVRRCAATAKQQFPHNDAREVCYREIWDLCKRIEFVWTDLTLLADPPHAPKP